MKDFLYLFLQLTNRQFEELVERFNYAINEHDVLEKRLKTILHDIEQCANLTGDSFTSQTRQYLNVNEKIDKISCQFIVSFSGISNYSKIDYNRSSEIIRS